ncbi:MAG TPA: hypothetical protein VGC78_10180 [Gaiellaceae bacterium]
MLAVAADAAATGGPLGRAGAGFVLAAALVLVVGLLVRAPSFLPWAVGLAGVGYVLAHAHDRLVDGWAPLVGAGLLLAAELAAWSLEDDRRIHEERVLVVRRSLTVAAVVAAAGLVSFVLVAAAAVSPASGLALTAAGVVAAVSAVALVLRLLR